MKSFVSANVFVLLLFSILIIYGLVSIGDSKLSIGDLPSLFIIFSIVSVLFTEVFANYINRPINDLNDLIHDFNKSGNVDADEAQDSLNLKEITELKQYLIYSFNQVQQKIQAEIAKDRAEAANQAKSEFIANMSHDFVTALTSIMGLADLLLEAKDSKKNKEYLSNIKTASHTLLQLINDVLSFSKLESLGKQLRFDIVNLQSLADNVMSLVGNMAQQKDLLLDVSIPTEQNIVSDQNRLTRIMMNLLSNAIKFTAKGKVSAILTVEVKDTDEVILWMTVTDTGVGIPEEKSEEIFERFSRLDPSYKGHEAGAGLGLSIVKRFVEDLNGTITLTSQLGVGTTFKVAIPCKIALPIAIENSLEIAGKQGRLNQGLIHILLVEDNPVIAEITQRNLEAIGCKVDVAMTAKEALDLLQPTHEMIFLDIGLPDGNGLQVAKRIRNLESSKLKAIPIIAHTAHLAEEDKPLIFAAGIDDCLIKPMDKAQLETVLLKYTQSI